MTNPGETEKRVIFGTDQAGVALFSKRLTVCFGVGIGIGFGIETK